MGPTVGSGMLAEGCRIVADYFATFVCNFVRYVCSPCLFAMFVRHILSPCLSVFLNVILCTSLCASLSAILFSQRVLIVRRLCSCVRLFAVAEWVCCDVMRFQFGSHPVNTLLASFYIYCC